MSSATLAGPTTTAAATGTDMRGVLRSRWTTLRTRSTAIALAVGVVLPLAVMVLVLGLGQETFDLTGADLARPLTDSVGNHALLGPIIGALIGGSLYRHGTIVPTLLAEPRRVRVAVATLLVAGAAAAATAVVCALLGAAIALPWLAGQGAPVGEVVADPRLWWRALDQAAVVTAAGVLGAALAVLLRGVLGPVLVVVGIRITELTLMELIPGGWREWTFTFNLDAAADLTSPGLPVPVWQPVAHLLAVLTAVVTAALVTTARRDVA